MEIKVLNSELSMYNELKHFLNKCFTKHEQEHYHWFGLELDVQFQTTGAKNPSFLKWDCYGNKDDMLTSVEQITYFYFWSD